MRPKDLRRFVSMNNHLNFGSGMLGNVAKEIHFAAFLPSVKHSPLTLGESKSQILKRLKPEHDNKAKIEMIQQQLNGFIIPRWGGVTIINPKNNSKDDISSDDFGRFESMILAHARALLGLNDPFNFPYLQNKDNRIRIKQIKPVNNGVADWEIDAMVNVRMKHHGKMLIDMVEATLTLATKMSGLIIHKEIGECVNRAVDNLKKCISILHGNDNENNIDTNNRRKIALSYLRDGFLAAEEANRDPTMVTQQYFPLEQLLAIFCPLILPIFLPVVFGVTEAYKREWKRYKGEEVSESESEAENLWVKYIYGDIEDEEKKNEKMKKED